MKRIKIAFLVLFVAGFLTSCFEDRDDNPISPRDIKDFVWSGMNVFYVYKDEIPNLANDRFPSDAEYDSYLNSYESPESLFESLIYDRETVDRFSVIVPNYFEFEQQLAGTSISNGLEYNFYFKPGSTTEVFGIIRLVLNNSVASGLGLQRGQLFDAVNGVALTETNLSSLLNQNNYTLNLANYNDNGTDSTDDDVIESTSNSVNLNKQPYTENPVYLTHVFTIDGEKIGYLIYNGFTADFDNQLNAAFAEFQENNIQHLILDLRYNPGGSVNTASLLGSMVTGDYNGQIFAKLIYNNGLQNLNTNYNFTNTMNDGSSVNSLHLDKLYVLTTNRTASASEMVINSLSTYIDVVQIGNYTTGKSQASVTLYDSPDFRRQNVNPSHTYAMQPLVAISKNSSNDAVPASGLTPTTLPPLLESPRNYGTLGDINEPLLAAALGDILGTGRSTQHGNNVLEPIKDKLDSKPFEDGMYIDLDKLPSSFFNR